MKIFFKKVVLNFSPSYKLWVSIEEERKMLPDKVEEALTVHEIAALFYQKIFLVGQTFNNLLYQRRWKNVNGKDNGCKMKYVLKKQAIDLDEFSNELFF